VTVTVQSRALQKAAELIGGRKDLAARLGVTVEEIEKWTAGTRRTPREIFLRVVDVLLDELSPSNDSSDANEPPPGRSSQAYPRQDVD